MYEAYPNPMENHIEWVKGLLLVLDLHLLHARAETVEGIVTVLIVMSETKL